MNAYLHEDDGLVPPLDILAKNPRRTAQLFQKSTANSLLALPSPVGPSVEPARSSKIGDALQSAVSFVTSLHSKYSNFLVGISAHAVNDRFSAWDVDYQKAFEKTAIRFDLNPSLCRVPVTEASLGKHLLEQVAAEDIQPGKTPHAVVRIFVQLSGPNGRFGTGTLINEDTVVTAGHVLMADSGRPAFVHVTAGEGNSSEYRYGKCAVVPGNWYVKGAVVNDVCLIKLETPFNTVQPLNYRQSPILEHPGIPATIYGFPEDTARFAPAGQLCKSQSPCWYNSSRKMIQHEGDTERGCSGGPLIDASGRMFGVHRGCDYDKKGEPINEATMIDRHGNNFAAFLEILNSEQPIQGSALYNKQQSVNVKLVGEVKDVAGLLFSW